MRRGEVMLGGMGMRKERKGRQMKAEKTRKSPEERMRKRDRRE